MRLLLFLFATFLFASTAVASSDSLIVATLDSLTEREARLIRIDAGGFADLSGDDQHLAYYLARAGLAGRDMWIELNHRHSSAIRELLEGFLEPSVIAKARTQAAMPAVTLRKIKEYAALFFINGGQYNILNRQKYTLELGSTPEESRSVFLEAMTAAIGEPADERSKHLHSLLSDIGVAASMFDPSFEPVMLTKDEKVDYVAASHNNNYAHDVTLDDVTYVEDGKRLPNGANIDFLNSRIRKEDGKLIEEIFSVRKSREHIGPTKGLPDGHVREYGHFSEELERVRYWLEQAKSVTSSDKQRERLGSLIQYVTTGDNKYYDAANIAWVQDYDFVVDFVLGWVESYDDPLTKKGSWENTVAYINPQVNEQLDGLLANREYFEEHFPWDPEYRLDLEDTPPPKVDFHYLVQQQNRLQAKPLSGKNLPNKQSVRRDHGFKNMIMMNNRQTSDKVPQSGYLEEFYQKEWVPIYRERGAWARMFTTIFHEIVGHGAGTSVPREQLGSRYSDLEENRATLCAIHYASDPKIVDVDLLDIGGLEPQSPAGKAALENFQNLVLHSSIWRRVLGLQSTDGNRIRSPYTNGAVATMNWLRWGPEPLFEYLDAQEYRNDATLKANLKWIRTYLEKQGLQGSFGVDLEELEPGKHFLVISDPQKAAAGASALLALIQNARGSGDQHLFNGIHHVYAASDRALDELLGVKDASGNRHGGIRAEIKQRAAALGHFRFAYFVNPTMHLEKNSAGTTRVRLDYPNDLDSFLRQQLLLTQMARSTEAM